MIELFELIKSKKENGVIPYVSLDMKEERESGEEFGEWAGRLIQGIRFSGARVRLLLFQEQCRW